MTTLEELGFELRHVGINCNSEEEACDVAGRFLVLQRKWEIVLYLQEQQWKQ